MDSPLFPLRAAQAIGRVGCGGVEQMVMNYYRRINRTKIQFDFLVEEGSSARFDAEIEYFGGRIFPIPPPCRPVSQLAAYRKYCREERPSIFHSHLNSRSGLPLFAAKKEGIPVRIAHSHSVSCPEETIRAAGKQLLRPWAAAFATDLFACTGHAARWLFGAEAAASGKTVLLPDAIDLDRFVFRPEIRASLRCRLGIKRRFVVGHVGRMVFQKNHEFLLSVFAAFRKFRPDAALLLAGSGPLEPSIRQTARKLGIASQVYFLGVRDDVPELLQAMDLFVFPSRYEGFGMAAVEAQAAGLPTLVSDRVPREARLTGSVASLPLEVGPDAWAQQMCRMMTGKRCDFTRELRRTGYDIQTQSLKLEQLYLEHFL